jgi:hypothetical protein
MTILNRTGDSLAEVLTGISAAKKVLIIAQIYNYVLYFWTFSIALSGDWD